MANIKELCEIMSAVSKQTFDDKAIEIQTKGLDRVAPVLEKVSGIRFVSEELGDSLKQMSEVLPSLVVAQAMAKNNNVDTPQEINALFNKLVSGLDNALSDLGCL